VFYRNLLDAVRADAGIESATLAAYNPLNLIETPALGVAIEGYEPRRGEDRPSSRTLSARTTFARCGSTSSPAERSRTATTRRRHRW
jgi:hypothetical protein